MSPTERTPIVTLAATLAAVALFASCSRYDPTQDIQAFLDEHLAQAQAEDVEGFLDTYHRDSPERAEAVLLVERLWNDFDLEYATENLSLLDSTSDAARIQVDIITRKVSGGEFKNNRTTQILTLRMDDGQWKFFSGEIVATVFLE